MTAPAPDRGASLGVMSAAMPQRVGVALAALHRGWPSLEVRMRQVWATSGTFTDLRQHRLDAAVVIGPIEGQRLPHWRVGWVARHAVVAEHHPLAARPVVRLDQVLAEPTFARPEDALPGWRSYWLNEDERGGPPRYARLARVGTECEALAAIGSGRVVGVAPATWGRHPGLCSVPIRGLAPAPVLLVTRPDPPEWVTDLRTGLSDPLDEPSGRLTPAERDVAELVAQGWSNRAIADELSCSPRTVETHVAHALQRLALRSRAHLAAWVVHHPA